MVMVSFFTLSLSPIESKTNLRENFDPKVVIGRGKTSFNRFLSSASSSTSSTKSSPSSTSPLSTSSNLPSLATREKERKRMLVECDLHRRESGAVECRWAREELERRKSRRKVKNVEVVGKGLDFEGSGVVIVDGENEKENTRAVKVIKEDKFNKSQVKKVEKEESSIQSTPSSSSTPIPPTRTLSTPPSTTTSTKMQASGPIPVETTKEEDLEEEEEEEEHGMFSGAGKFLLAGGTAGAGTLHILSLLESLSRTLTTLRDSFSNGDGSIRSIKSLLNHFPFFPFTSYSETTHRSLDETGQDSEEERW